jgi:hypothetical protein
MGLNHFSLVIGIHVVAEIEASVTSNYKSSTLVLLPSKCNANCLVTFGWPLCILWKKERHPTL